MDTGDRQDCRNRVCFYGEPSFIEQHRGDDGETRSFESNRSDGSTENNDNNTESWSTRVTTGPDGGGGDDDSADHSPSSRRTDPPRPNRILLVHGLERGIQVNCDRVFNLFCLYGNVRTVKVLRNDKVLVELDDIEAAKRCVSNLHLLPLDGTNKLKVKYSKHSFIHDQMVFNKLLDGTPSQKIYWTSKLNRFPKTGTCLDRRRIASPSKILHFFNAPTDVCGLTVHKSVSEAIGLTDAIHSITILPRRPGAKCSTGLIELKSIALAVKTVLLANHMTFESKRSRFPFLTKLCFSKWSEIHLAAPDSTTLRLSPAPHQPWQLHNSEHAVPTTEFPISLATVVSGGSGGGDDSRWTLWVVTDDGMAAAVVAAALLNNNNDEAGERNHVAERGPLPTLAVHPRPHYQQTPHGFANIDQFLLDMLRNRLHGGLGSLFDRNNIDDNAAATPAGDA